jgi:hypothetical protein
MWTDGLTAATLTIGACLGLGSLAVTGAQAIWPTGKAREAKLRLFLPVLLTILSSVIGALALLSTATLRPRTYDLFLYAFVATLGFQASFWMGRMFASHALLAAAGGAVYAGVLAISLLYAIQIVSPRRAPIDILWLIALRTSIPMVQRWPGFSWSAILCTVAASVFFEWRLAAAADEESRSVEPALAVNS